MKVTLEGRGFRSARLSLATPGIPGRAARRGVLLAVLPLLLTIPCRAMNPPDSLGSVSTYSHRADTSGVSITEIVNHCYHLVFLSCPPGSWRQMLLSEESSNTYDSRNESDGGHVRLSAWRMPRRSGDQPLWTIDAWGNGQPDRGMPEILIQVPVETVCRDGYNRALQGRGPGTIEIPFGPAGFDTAGATVPPGFRIEQLR